MTSESDRYRDLADLEACEGKKHRSSSQPGNKRRKQSNRGKRDNKIDHVDRRERFRKDSSQRGNSSSSQRENTFEKQLARNREISCKPSSDHRGHNDHRSIERESSNRSSGQRDRKSPREQEYSTSSGRNDNNMLSCDSVYNHEDDRRSDRTIESDDFRYDKDDSSRSEPFRDLVNKSRQHPINRNMMSEGEESIRMARVILSKYGEAPIIDNSERLEMLSEIAMILAQLKAQKKDMEVKLTEAQDEVARLRLKKQVDNRQLTGLAEQQAPAMRNNSLSSVGNEDYRALLQNREEMLQMIQKLEATKLQIETNLRNAKQDKEQVNDESSQRHYRNNPESVMLKKKLWQIESTRSDFEAQLLAADQEAHELRAREKVTLKEVARSRLQNDSEGLRRLEIQRKRLFLEIRKNEKEREDITAMIEDLASSHERVQQLLERGSVQEKLAQIPIQDSIPKGKAHSVRDLSVSNASMSEFGHSSVPAFESNGYPVVSRRYLRDSKYHTREHEHGMTHGKNIPFIPTGSRKGSDQEGKAQEWDIISFLQKPLETARLSSGLSSLKDIGHQSVSALDNMGSTSLSQLESFGHASVSAFDFHGYPVISRQHSLRGQRSLNRVRPPAHPTNSWYIPRPSSGDCGT